MLYLQRLDLIEAQIAELEGMIAEAMKAHEDAVVRLSELPGLGVDSAQQIIAEIGPRAESFPSAGQLASWVGVCPGLQESAGESSSNRSAKGNRAMRRLRNQLAHAAVGKRDCYLQIVFKRLSPRLGYAKAVWAIAHRLCRLIWKVLHEGVHYVELGPAVTALTLKRRKQRLVSQLKKLGYSVQLMPRVWQVVSRDAKASCCTKDEGGPLGAVLQEKASNSGELLRSNAAVVNVTVKRREQTRLVRIRETNANEALMTHRNTTLTTSKPEMPATSGKSTAVTYLLAVRCWVYRSRESNSGLRTELENLVGDAKGKRHKWKSHLAESTNAQARSGLLRSRGEPGLTTGERREQVTRVGIVMGIGPAANTLFRHAATDVAAACGDNANYRPKIV